MGLLLTIFFTLLACVLAIVVYILLTYPRLVNDLSEFILIIRKIHQPIEKLKRKGYLFVDVFESHVRRNPEKPLILYKDEVHTYRDVDRTANKAANFLRKTATVEIGSIVGVFMQNEPAYVSTVLSLLKLGVTGALLNYNLRGETLLHCIRVGRMKAIICGHDPTLVSAMQDIMPKLQADSITVIVIQETEEDGPLPDGFISGDMSSPLASTEAVPRDVRKGSSYTDSAFFFYTSGTTGNPKAVHFPQNKLLGSGMILQLYHLNSADVVYIPLPLFHSAGMAIGLCNVIYTGATAVIRTKFSASHFWDDVRRYKANVIQYIGEICRYLLAQPKSEIDGKYSHSVRLAFGNGLAQDIWLEFKDRFNIVQIGEFFSASEANHGFFNTDGTVGSVGRYSPLLKRLMDNVEIIQCDWEMAEPIRGSDGKCIILPKGSTGLMVCKITQSSPFSGYVAGRSVNEKKIIRNVRVMGDEYFNTGDLMMIDENGYVFFKDRIGDTFRWKGENVASSEVAAVLSELEFIGEAVVYGIKIPGYDGRVGMAAVIFEEDTQASQWEQLYTHVTNSLPLYACPKLIRIKGQMETTNTYKYRKLNLVKEGFQPETCKPDRLFFMDSSTSTYIPLDSILHNKILNKEIIVH